MKIFITGASGFLGKHIIQELLKKKEYELVVTSRSRSGLDSFEDRITFVENEGVCKYDFSTVDVIINCAFPRAADGKGYADGLKYLDNLFRAVEPHKDCGFIDISSQSLYSFQRTEAANEDTQLDLEAVYDVGKYCMELLADARLTDHKRVHLRLASLIGPKFDQRIINRFIKMVIAGQDITVTGGQQLFGFLDVRDCAEAICRVIECWDKVDKTGQVFNIGAEDSNSLSRIAEVSVSVGKEYGFSRVTINEIESDEWKNTSLDASKFYKYFQWKPKYRLEDTARSIYGCELL